MAVVSFLTIILFADIICQPIDIKYTATNIPISTSWGTDWFISRFSWAYSLALEPQITSLLVVLYITLITGLHHTDALADFGDGLMVKRGRESKKMQCMIIQ